jgi:hypothetical protein
MAIAATRKTAGPIATGSPWHNAVQDAAHPSSGGRVGGQSSRRTRFSGWGTGKSRSSSALTTLKIRVFPLIPTASSRTAVAANSGLFKKPNPESKIPKKFRHPFCSG